MSMLMIRALVQELFDNETGKKPLPEPIMFVVLGCIHVSSSINVYGYDSNPWYSYIYINIVRFTGN